MLVSQRRFDPSSSEKLAVGIGPNRGKFERESGLNYPIAYFAHRTPLQPSVARFQTVRNYCFVFATFRSDRHPPTTRSIRRFFHFVVIDNPVTRNPYLQLFGSFISLRSNIDFLRGRLSFTLKRSRCVVATLSFFLSFR